MSTAKIHKPRVIRDEDDPYERVEFIENSNLEENEDDQDEGYSFYYEDDDFGHYRMIHPADDDEDEDEDTEV